MSATSSASRTIVSGSFITLGAACRELLVDNKTALAKCFIDLETGTKDYRLTMRDCVDAITVPTPLPAGPLTAPTSSETSDGRAGTTASGTFPTQDSTQHGSSETPTDVNVAFEDMVRTCERIADDNLLDISTPTWVKPTAKWLSRCLIDKVSQEYRIAVPDDCPLPTRGDLKREIATARSSKSAHPRETIVPSRVSYPGQQTDLSREHEDSPVTEISTSHWTKAKQHALRSQVRPLIIKTDTTKSSQNEVLKQVNTLLGKPILKEFYFDGSDIGAYADWRVRVCDEIDNYSCSREVSVEIVWACLKPSLRSRIRRRVSSTDRVQRGHVAIFDVLDDIYLTPNELKAFSSRWEKVVQLPNETLQDYALRFEELVHTRRSLLEADIPDSELVQKFSNGFCEPAAILAKMLVDPLGRLDYEGFKLAVVSFVQSGDENVIPLLGSKPPPGAPKPSASDTSKNAKKPLARKAAFDTDDCYAQVHLAITKPLGLDPKACLRCGQNANHFARDCNSPNIYRCADRCQTCGDLRSENHRCRISPRRVVCSRCHKTGHVAGVCRSQRKSSSGKRSEVPESDGEAQFKDKFPVTNSKCALVTSLAAAAVRKNAPDLVVDFLRRLPRQPEVHLTLGVDGAYCKASCLVDSGANCSLISSGLVAYLTKRGVIKDKDVVPLPSTIPVGVASGKSISGSHIVHIEFASGRLEGTLEFLVCDDVDPDILLGTNMFPAIGVQLTSTGEADTTNFRCTASTAAPPPNPIMAARATPSLPTAEIVQTAEGKRVMCHCGPLERLVLYPYREKQRQLSQTNNQILTHRMLTMASQGKVESCNEADCTAVLAAVICDKESGVRPRVYPDPMVDKRYRVTVDCRPINRLVLVGDVADEDASMMLMPQTMIADGTPQLTDAAVKEAFRQAEPNITAKLNSIPFSYQAYYKLDLTDAYSGVLLPPALRSIFGTTSRGGDGRQLWWVYKVLPQGWVFSSCLFNSAMQLLVDIINEQLHRLQIKAVCRHNKDDILIAAQDAQNCQKAADVAIQIFIEHGFHPNPAKSCGPTDKVHFCGVTLRGGFHRPEGSRQAFTESTYSLAWSEFVTPSLKSKKVTDNFETLRLARLGWLRKWSGTMNYLRNHLPPEALTNLYVLQDALSRYQKHDCPLLQEELGDRQNERVTGIGEAFQGLLQFYLSGIPPMVATHLGGTVVLGDSNTDSWAVIILKAVFDDAGDINTPHSLDVPVIFPDSMSLFDTNDLKPLVFLPVRMLGGRWSQTDRKRSSTWRERAAVVAAIADAESELEGPVTVVLDNQNGMKTWKDVLDTFHGVWLTRWEAFCRNVNKVIWVPRSECPRWADALARSIANDESVTITETTTEAIRSDYPQANTAVTASLGSSTSSTSDPVPPSSTPLPLSDEPDLGAIDVCVNLLDGLRRCFLAWKTRVPFEESFDVPVDPESARRWLYDVQRGDEECGKVLSLIDRKLSRFWIDDCGLMRLKGGYVIPRKYAPDIARKYHCFYGHSDSKQTIACISKHFYIFGLAKAVQKVISRCICQYTRARKGTDRPVATSLGGAMVPMDCVFIDVVGPQPLSAKHPYRFVLSCMDAASRHIWFFAISSSTSQSLIDTLESRLIYPYGCMRSLRMDNASSFRSTTFRGWCYSRGIVPTYVPSFAPHRNSLLERQHGVLKKVLKVLCAGDTDLWPQFLPVAMARCNSRCLGDISTTPFELFYGRPCCSPWSDRFCDLRSGISDDSVKFEADRRLRRRNAQLKDIIALLDKAEADSFLRTPTTNPINNRRQFKKGDFVLRWREAAHSLDSSWYGPFTVDEALGNYTYKLNDGSVHDSKNLCIFHPVHH